MRLENLGFTAFGFELGELVLKDGIATTVIGFDTKSPSLQVMVVAEEDPLRLEDYSDIIITNVKFLGENHGWAHTYELQKLPQNTKIVTEMKDAASAPVLTWTITKAQFDAMYVGSDGKIAVHCETQQKAIEFLNLAHRFGYKWINGGKYIDFNNWKRYRSNTCYLLSHGTYGKTSDFARHQIVEYGLRDSQPQPQCTPTPTFTKADLRSGDKLVRRDGEARFVLKETGTVHRKYGELACGLNEWNEEFLDVDSAAEFDIMQVWRGDEKVWERVEIITMDSLKMEIATLKAEIAKLKASK